MQAKPRVAIVGAGNLASALAAAMRRAGFRIEAVIARSRGKSLARAAKLARQVGARATVATENVRADLVWFCIPDSQIAIASRSLADKISWQGKVVFHSSGALNADELRTLRKKGAAVASVHPFMTFVRDSRPGFVGVPFAIDGDGPAVRMARNIVKQLGGRSYAIRRQDKAAYHAWGTLVSPLLTALLATAQEVAVMAGVKRTAAARRMTPILLQTLANYAEFGARHGFSGPIVRGDAETVRRHLKILRGVPAAREVYLALAKAALEYLPGKNKGMLRQLLQEPE